MKTDIGLTNKQRQDVIEFLNKILANEYILLVKTKNYHWNVFGHHFHDMHKFLDEQYKMLEISVDDIAERIRSLGGMAPGTLKEFVETGSLKEEPGVCLDCMSMIKNLLSDHETVIKILRKDIEECERLKDAGTGNFLTDLMEKHEKMAWMLRAFTEEETD